METTRLSLLDGVCQSPEDEKWQEFAAIYTPFVEGFLFRSGVRHEDVADIRQEVMQVMIRDLPRFEHNRRKGAFRTWLRNVIANRLRSFRRSKANKPQAVGGSVYLQLAEELVDTESVVSRAWDTEHNQHVIQSLLEIIADRFQVKTMRAFRRVVLEEQEAADVADQLGMTINAVRIAQARVLRSLRALGEELID